MMMEQKHVLLLAALGVGIGLGVGVGTWVGEKDVLLSVFSVVIGLIVGLGIWFGFGGDSDESNHISENQIVKGLKKLVIDGKDSKVTFDDFPYYLSEKNKILLTTAGYFHLRQHDLSKHTRNLSPVRRAILLSGHAEHYHHKLAGALAHCFESKLLSLDIAHFSLKMQGKYGCPRKEPYFKRSIFEATREFVSGLFVSLSILPSKGAIGAPSKSTSCYFFDEKLFLHSLYKVLVSISEAGSVILYIKNVEKVFLGSPRMYRLFQKILNKLLGSVLILGSRPYDLKYNCTKVNEKLTMLFPYNIEITPPQDETRLKIWKSQLKKAMKKTHLKDYTTHIAEVLAENDLYCDDLDTVDHNDMTILSNQTEEVVASAIFHHLKDAKNPKYRNGILIISAKSLRHVLSLFQEGESSEKDNKKTKKESKRDDSRKEKPKESKKDGDIKASAKSDSPDNAFEECIRQELIPANEIKVTFSDIGALDDVKESLQEAVMLPLRRPDLFKGDGVLKPCKGVLLFGPPGTGKTMLAKAIANEAGASFINVSPSTITSMWQGQSEKNVRALFSLAAKVAPTIIFIDEVDSMLGQRSSTREHSSMRRVKNEFMSRWDGLLSKPDEKITVLAATNMPFDLDEAIIRRFQRRIMVGLPSADNRETILKTILAKEKSENMNFEELSTMTEGYSGSDLKNLCMTAAYRPLKELIQQEKEKEMKKKKKVTEVEILEEASIATEEDKEDQVIALRPLNMEDMREAKNKVAASFAAEGSTMTRLKEWNDLYGEGGSRKKEEQLSYFF